MILVSNPKARYEYEISKKIVAGIKLIGPEVKSLRNKSASLKGSYVKIIGNEAFLINAHINPYKFASNQNYKPTRTRKLLMKKREILKLKEQVSQKRWALVPLSFKLIKNRIKVEVGLGRGKREYEKREKEKKRDLKRRLAKQYKQRNIKI